METSSQSYRINITNPVYCEMITDTKEGTVYGVVKSLGEAQQAQCTAVEASGEVYGNGDIVDSSSLLVGLTLALDITKIPIEVQADIYNFEVEDGVVLVKAGVQPKYIAVGYEVPQTDGKSEYIWLLKGRPKPLNKNVQQSNGNINYSTDTMNVSFVKRKSDNRLKFFADASNPSFTAEQAAKWFAQGPSKPVKAGE